jgi:hypothetical protein
MWYRAMIIPISYSTIVFSYVHLRIQPLRVCQGLLISRVSDADMLISTISAYSSALKSYITFCRAHHFPIDPTPDTLSFYTVYMCNHIKPKSVDNYLSGIANQLEPFFPAARSHRHHLLVTRTLKGCNRGRSPEKSEVSTIELGYQKWCMGSRP